MLIRIPVLSSQLLSNLLGVIGLVGFAVALGGLLGNWWATMLTGSAMLVGLAYVSYLHAQPAAAAAADDLPAAPPVRAAA